MNIITLTKANIKRQKSSFIGVFLLMFIITFFLCAVLSIWSNSQTYIKTRIEHMGYGTIVNWVSWTGDKEEIQDSLESLDDVSKVDFIECLLVYKDLIVNNQETSSVIVMPYAPNQSSYQIFLGSSTVFDQEPSGLQAGEVYVPISYQSLYKSEVGDTLLLPETEKSYTIKGFFEDPFMGSSIMEIKTILMSEEDILQIRQGLDPQAESKLTAGWQVNIYQSVNSTMSYMEFETQVNSSAVVANRWTTLGTPRAINYMTLLTNLFAGILMAFVVILLIVTVIILSHSIGSNIELEYVNMGVLKALGYTKGKLRLVQMLAYLSVIIFAAILGFVLSMPFIGIINKILTPVTGVAIPGSIALLPCLVVMAAILLLLFFFIVMKTIRIGKISPLLAIRGGRRDVYFSSRFHLPIHQKALGFWLSVRQVLSNKKQYISTCLVTALLIFFMIMISSLTAWVGKDGEGVIQVFFPYQSNLEVVYTDEAVKEQAEETIASYSSIENSFETYQTYLLINGNDCQCQMISDVEDYHTILKGRTCLYENEVLITQMVADDMNLSIGQTVTIKEGDKSAEFIISGIYECANDAGFSFAMGFQGYEYLTGEEPDGVRQYSLDDTSKIDQLIAELNEIYEGSLAASLHTMSGIDTMLPAIKSLSLFVYMVAFLFVFVVVILVLNKIFLREQTDLGIYKSVGFTSRRLRLQLALRFALVSLIGCLLGLVLNAFLAVPVGDLLFSTVGMSMAKIESTWQSVIIPFIYITGLCFLLGYLASRKVKRVNPKDLITAD